MRSTTSGMAWPKHRRLMKIGAAQVVPLLGKRSDQLANRSLIKAAPMAVLAVPTVDPIRKTNPSMSATVSAVLAVSTTRGCARMVKPASASVAVMQLAL
eukprot:scaffold309290_cov30-Tisochrysis_lutea.AAC.2